MKSLNSLILLSTICCSACAKSPDQPNIIFILADDLGYGELGCYGQKIIETPNIDKLANNGIRFTNYYAGSSVSAPSRSTLQTGLHTGHTPVRGNDEMSSRGEVWDHQAALENPYLEGQYPMPADTHTLGHLMQESGYTTGMVGKWGLGYPGSESTPTKMGYDYFYGYNCQRQAHTYYPMFLYENDERVMLDNAPLLSPKFRLDPDDDIYDEASYEKFERKEYSGDLMFDALTKFVDRNAENPFMLMWTTPIPHVSLQAPDRWVEYYRKKIGDEEPFVGGGYLPCRYPKATYAAMISYLDEQVGKLVQQLKDRGIYDNTLIVFTSDNGATYNGGSSSVYFNSNGIFNSQRGWGKVYLHEGGIRVPMILSWGDKIEEPRESDHICASWDFRATFAELIGAKDRANDGLSFVDEIYGRKQSAHDYLYWEYPDNIGQKALRQGRWKLLIRNIKKGKCAVELFNIESDPREQYDLSAQYPDKVAELEALMREAHVESDNSSFQF